MGAGDSNGLRITQEEMTVYKLVDGQRDARRIIDEANLGEFETCKALGNLMTAGLIGIEQAPSVSPVLEEITTPLASYADEVTPSSEIHSEEISPSEAIHVERPILDQEEKPSFLSAFAGRSPRHWISIAVMAGFLTVMGLGIKRFEQHLAQGYDAITFFQGLSDNNKVRAIRFSVLTYYYSKGHLPVSIDVLIQEGYLPRDTVSGLKARAVRYLPDEETGEFILSIDK